MTSSQFSAPPIELGRAAAGAVRLLPLRPSSCPSLAAGIVAMEPWSVMNYPAETLAAFLAGPGGGVSRYVVSVNGDEAGAISVRHPWLKGPYLELLALLPQAQDQGIGSSIMAWFETAALQHGARNLWVCASSFNARGLRFYERHGFTRAATLPGLVADGYDEILLRKFPLGPA
ncbi:GNAT family N-acetyltransferase [Methyloceanibacter sp.]|uniref:GNAT family N-acetyltransferase n=1 Tax=Methyloceanibacter sp. TaxID=1965321 RepID=UPI003D6D510F